MLQSRLVPSKIEPTQFSFPVLLVASAIPTLILLLASINSIPALTFGCLLILFGVAIGWGRLVEAPSNYATGGVILIVGIINLLLLEYSGDYAWCLVSTALALPISFIMEIIRSHSPRRMVWSISTMISGCIIGVCANSWVLIIKYPIMRLLSWGILPATTVAILALILPTKSPSLRLLSCIASAVSINLVISYFYLSKFPELSLAIAFFPQNPAVSTWILVILLGIFAGITTVAISFLFFLPPHRGQEILKFTLLLLPVIFSALPIYALARIIGG